MQSNTVRQLPGAAHTEAHSSAMKCRRTVLSTPQGRSITEPAAHHRPHSMGLIRGDGLWHTEPHAKCRTKQIPKVTRYKWGYRRASQRTPGRRSR